MKAVPERSGADDQAVAPARAAAARHGDGPPPARGKLDPHALRRLQAGAGNAAVSRLVAQRAEAQPVQRLASGLPEAPAKTQPQDDPRFRAAAGEIRAKGRALAGHPPPAAEARAAQDAAVAPADDREAQAKAAQVVRMDAAKPGAFDKAAFVAAVDRAVAAQAPKNLDEADSFASSGKADGIRSQVLGQVTAGKQTSAKDVTEKAAEAPDPSRAVEKPVTALPERPAAVAPPAPDPAAMAVAPAPPPQTDLSATPQRTDATMAESGITPAQLAASNEPQFESALAAKQAADQHAATAPAALRAAEQQKVAAERSAASALGAEGMQGMAAARTATGAHVKAGQSAAKARDEEARAKLSAELKAAYDGTKADVDKLLADLDGQVGAAFDQGEAQAKAAFTADHQARMQRYKDERYAGASGAARWVADKFTGLPAEAGQIFQLSRALYESRMRAVISDVADLIGRQLAAAKARIARGREEAAGIVARQPRELQRFAADAAQEFGGRFGELESAVDDKSKALVDDLAQRYTAARGAVDDEIKALQAENKGLLDAAMDALAETAATVKQLAGMLASVAARAAGAIDRIIAKPIEFLGHLVDAVKSGVLGFAARAGEHLKQGLKDWLLGQLAAGGIELPETLDAKGIIRLVLSVLGLTWANIRARIVRQIPEPAMRALEGSFELVRVLMTEGVGGLWRWIVQKAGDLKDTVLGAIKDFVLEKIVTAGVTWIVSLLNPASAFVRACKAIYDVIMFFVHQAARLKDFVDTVLDSIEGIAAGSGGGIPAKIEAALAKALPLVLDFLASLLGLGGISEKIRGILEKVQAPVTKAVDWLIGKIVTAGKAAWRGLKRGGAKVVDSVKGAKDALLATLRVRKPVLMGGNTHHVYLEERGGRNVLMMASTPGLLLVKIDKALSNEKVRSRRKVVSELQAARIRIPLFHESVRTAMGESSEPKIRAARSALTAELDRIAARLAEIGATFDIDDLKGTKWTLDGRIRDGIDIRNKLYGHSGRYLIHKGVKLSEGHQEKLARQSQFGSDPGYTNATYYCPGVPALERSPHLAPDKRVTLDHKVPVAQHWNEHGRNGGHQLRVDFYTDATGLVAMCRSCNSAKNSGGVEYLREVGPGFEGPDGSR